MTDFEQARKQMVDTQLRTSNVTDRRELNAIGTVPREMFVPEDRRELAYIDEVHPLGGGRYLAPVAPFAKLVQLAAIDHQDSILDVGCANGYSTAVLAQLGASVVGIDSDANLVRDAVANLAALGADNVTIMEGSFEAGAKSKGPFDVIIIEGTIDAVPPALLAQLADRGRLVALIRSGATAVAHVYIRAGNDVAARPEFNASLPPLAVAKPAESFVF